MFVEMSAVTEREKERESRISKAHQHKTGHSVPFEVKNTSNLDNQVN